MTRQRIRPSLKRSVYDDCPGCRGTGVVKTPESVAIEVVRLLLLAAQHPDVVKVAITVASNVAEYLNNRKRRVLAELEDEGPMRIEIIDAGDAVSPEHLIVNCRDANDRQVSVS